MSPVVNGLKAEYAGQIEFVSLDIDDPRTDSFKEQLGFVKQPYFVLLDGEGNIVQSWRGSTAKDDFVAAFDAL